MKFLAEWASWSNDKAGAGKPRTPVKDEVITSSDSAIAAKRVAARGNVRLKPPSILDAALDENTFPYPVSIRNVVNAVHNLQTAERCIGVAGLSTR
jgi:hypothetical protein